MARTKGPRYYTTTKSAQQFVGEIVTLLGEFGASSYHVQNQNSQPTAVAFTMPTPNGDLAFKFEPDVQGIKERLKKSRKYASAKPEAIAWAQARHFIELQLEVVESGVFRATHVWAGFTMTKDGRTVGEMIEDRADELLPGETLMLPGA